MIEMEIKNLFYKGDPSDQVVCAIYKHLGSSVSDASIYPDGLSTQEFIA